MDTSYPKPAEWRPQVESLQIDWEEIMAQDADKWWKRILLGVKASMDWIKLRWVQYK